MKIVSDGRGRAGPSVSARETPKASSASSSSTASPSLADRFEESTALVPYPPGAVRKCAQRDAGLHARVVSRMPMLYANRADATKAGLPHVRAASGVALVASQAGARLAVVQDDVGVLALVVPNRGAP